MADAIERVGQLSREQLLRVRRHVWAHGHGRGIILVAVEVQHNINLVLRLGGVSELFALLL